jgi:hypothetical protein
LHVLDFTGIAAKNSNGRAELDSVNLPETYAEVKRIRPEPLPTADGKKAERRQA